MSSNTARIKTRYRPRLKGAERQTTARSLAADYDDGASIRGLVDKRGMSYATVRKLLLEEGVELRKRGGRVRRARAEAP
ncbi:helix-turn-helix domain-containing protein [Streptomyces sp. NBC_01590]|uniref:helix-turn-helix domain-containing protein n=1 Tax=Streptomyces sp. NBC_01590 TaxID=2975887 RepID=UPI0038659A53